MTKKRRTYTPAYKFEVVMESLKGEKSNTQICRERNLTESLLYRWQREFLDKDPSLFADSKQAEQTSDHTAHIAELEQMVGRLTMELEALKKSMTLILLITPSTAILMMRCVSCSIG